MVTEKKLLIAGGGYADIPLIEAAQSLGYFVITSGNRPEDLGHKVSDLYEPGDYSDPQAMLKIANKHSVDAVCACCNDFSAISAAYVAEKLKLPGHDSYQTALLIHHKDKYRHFAMENEINSPFAKSFSAAALKKSHLNLFHFPIMIKPVDLTGGKGILKINNPDEVLPSIIHATKLSKQNRIVLEEFVEGSRHGFSTFLVGGKVAFSFSDNEHYFNNPYMVSGASTPSDICDKTKNILCSQIEKIANLLSLTDGILHLQYILTKDQPIIIEICRRSPGDLYIRFVELATGVPYPLWIIKSITGSPLTDIYSAKPIRNIIRHCVMSHEKGEIQGVHFHSDIEDKIIEKHMWWKKGGIISDETTQKLGIVMLQFASREELKEIAGVLPDLIKVEVK